MIDTAKEATYSTFGPAVLPAAQLIYDTAALIQASAAFTYTNLTEWHHESLKNFEGLIFSDVVTQALESQPQENIDSHINAFKSRRTRITKSDGTPMDTTGATGAQIIQLEFLGGATTMFRNMEAYGNLFLEQSRNIDTVTDSTSRIAKRLSAVHADVMSTVNVIFTTPDFFNNQRTLAQALLDDSTQTIDYVNQRHRININIPRSAKPYDKIENFITYINQLAITYTSALQITEAFEEEKRGCPFRRVKLGVQEGKKQKRSAVNGVHAYVDLVIPSFKRTLQHVVSRNQ